ncbi:hypothetical protein HAX54_043561 [Datura stramonium]|uniref:Uncharacterized protein n=1 Tax=Datura stramonium TaxID=4076 RepID=A0ABS8SNN7_DATST|nr:hypothetical protein [Datura stramonium]
MVVHLLHQSIDWAPLVIQRLAQPWVLSGRKLDLENYRNQNDRKLQSSNSSLSGTSSHGSVPSIANFEESSSYMNCENLANNSDNSVNVEPCDLISNLAPLEEDVKFFQSSIDEANEQPSHAASGDGDEIVVSVDKADSMDHKDSVLGMHISCVVILHFLVKEESTVTLRGKECNKPRSLTLEEATDTILFCSSIVHDLAYRAANIAIEKEDSVLLKDSRPTVTIVGKANSDRRDPRGRISGRRNSKSSQKARQKMETDAKPPQSNTSTESDDKTDKPATALLELLLKVTA